MKELYKDLIERKAKVKEGKGNNYYEPGYIFTIKRIEEDEVNEGVLWAFGHNDVMWGVKLTDLEIIKSDHIRCKNALALHTVPYLELDLESKVLGIGHEACACGSFSADLEINFCPICGERL